MIEELTSTFSVTGLCIIASVSRSGFYKWRNRQNQSLTRKQKEDEHIKDLIVHFDHLFNHTYGYPRLTEEINDIHFKKVNHKRVYRLQKQLGIQAQIFKKKVRYKHEGYKAQNVLNRDFRAKKPFEKWVTDITYLSTGITRLYLSTILDLCTKEVVSYHVSEHNDNDLVVQTLNKALEKGSVDGTMIHSDQGHQYTSHAYTNLLEENDMVKSMSRKANCWDNAPIESFFGRLKEESMRIHKPKTKQEIRRVIDDYMDLYNHRRRQKKLGGQAPINYKHTIAA
ncbi:IS3 family transposase [Virgibacillus natechei]|nr:IS3 family transposase [Virgibacillus natechei]